MIPDVPDLNDAFASLTIGETAELPHGQQAIACPAVDRMDVDGPAGKQPEVGIAYHKPTKVSLDSLIACVERELRSQEHALFDGEYRRKSAVATNIIGLAVACSSTRAQVRPTLNTIIESISQSVLNQFAILRLSPGDDGIHVFGDFSFGRLNVHRLEHVCTQAGSDYFDRYRSQLRDCTAAMRIVKNVRLIDFGGSRLGLREYKPEQHALIYRLLEHYHYDIADGFWDNFRFDMIREQALMSAIGVGSISPNVFWQLNIMSMFVAVFTRDLPGRGWVAPQNNCVHMTRSKPSLIARATADISQELRVADWGNLALDESIQLFSEYLAAANEHEAEGRIEEALLHTVFALDLLLGAKADEALTLVLAERAGFLSYLPLNIDLADAIKFLRETYDMRSGYAHRGQRGKLNSTKSGMALRERYELLRKGCRAILAASCWARRQTWCQGRDSWLARIDFLRAKYRAAEPTDDEIEILGLRRIHSSQVKLPEFVIDWGELPQSRHREGSQIQ